MEKHNGLNSNHFCSACKVILKTLTQAFLLIPLNMQLWLKYCMTIHNIPANRKCLQLLKQNCTKNGLQLKDDAFRVMTLPKCNCKLNDAIVPCVFCVCDCQSKVSCCSLSSDHVSVEPWWLNLIMLFYYYEILDNFRYFYPHAMAYLIWLTLQASVELHQQSQSA